MVGNAQGIDKNRRAWDFKMTTINGSQYLTCGLGNLPTSRTDLKKAEREPARVMLKSSYQEELRLQIIDVGTFAAMDHHEFTVIDNGRSVISLTRNHQIRDVTDLPCFGDLKTTKIGNSGFHEIDISKGRVGDHKFVWNSLDHARKFYHRPVA